MTSSAKTSRRGRDAKRSKQGTRRLQAAAAVWPGVEGGRYAPLSESEMKQIHAAVLHLLETVGLSQAPASMIERVTAEGGRLTEPGRLLFPRSLVEAAIHNIRRDVILYTRRPGESLNISGTRVHTSTGGGTPAILDLDTREYRPSTAKDLHDSARVVDVMEHIHIFSRPMVCTDAPNPLTLDVNTIYACLAATNKHVCVSVTAPENVSAVADICYEVAGGEAAFRKEPFVTVMATHVVPPMRFATEACEVVEQAVLHGMPVQLISAGQMGATSPVTIAGSLVQALCESLAGVTFAWLVEPHARIVFAPKPLVSDLRTGAMCGGSGEQAVLMASAAQMGRFYGLPTSSIAGYTDSKIHDAQAGYEKNLSVTLAAHAGCNIITHSCGTLASMLGCSLESFVIDNDMLGGVLRSLRGPEINAETLAAEVIAEVVDGDGHYLGHPQTLERMETDYVYPHIADRQVPSAWAESGSKDMLTRALERTRQILHSHRPQYIDRATDARIRARYDIILPSDVVSPTARNTEST